MCEDTVDGQQLSTFQYSIQDCTGTYCIHIITKQFPLTFKQTVAGFHKSTVPSLINSFGWFPSFSKKKNQGHTSTIFGTTRNRSTEIWTFQVDQIQTSTECATWKWGNWKLIDERCNRCYPRISFITAAMNHWKNISTGWSSWMCNDYKILTVSKVNPLQSHWIWTWHTLANHLRRAKSRCMLQLENGFSTFQKSKYIYIYIYILLLSFYHYTPFEKLFQ